MVSAIVLVNTEPGREKEVLGWFRAIHAVRYAYEVYGLYDVILKLEAPIVGRLSGRPSLGTGEWLAFEVRSR